MAEERCPVCVPKSLEEQFQESEEYMQGQQFKSNNGHFSAKSNDLFQEDSGSNYAGIEFRKYKRFKYTTTAMLEELFSEIRVRVDAQMKNISRQGMYFETNSYFEPGGKVRVIFEKPLFKSKSKKFRSALTTVRWCKKLADEKEHSYAYGLGLKLN
jgi:hypothetical protein